MGPTRPTVDNAMIPSIRTVSEGYLTCNKQLLVRLSNVHGRYSSVLMLWYIFADWVGEVRIEHIRATNKISFRTPKDFTYIKYSLNLVIINRQGPKWMNCYAVGSIVARIDMVRLT
jgi:hypothetical protein